ncbi:MAG: hypothetical protein ACXWQQ_01485 [Pseudobdellovibrio sp.]
MRSTIVPSENKQPVPAKILLPMAILMLLALTTIGVIPILIYIDIIPTVFGLSSGVEIALSIACGFFALSILIFKFKDVKSGSPDSHIIR